MEILGVLLLLGLWISASDDARDLRGRLRSLQGDMLRLGRRLDKAPAARLGTPQELREILDLRAELADTQEEERHWRSVSGMLEQELIDLEKSRAKRDHTTEQARTWAIEDLLRKGLPIDETVRELRAIDNEHGYGAWK